MEKPVVQFIRDLFFGGIEFGIVAVKRIRQSGGFGMRGDDVRGIVRNDFARDGGCDGSFVGAVDDGAFAKIVGYAARAEFPRDGRFVIAIYQRGVFSARPAGDASGVISGDCPAFDAQILYGAAQNAEESGVRGRNIQIFDNVSVSVIRSFKIFVGAGYSYRRPFGVLKVDVFRLYEMPILKRFSVIDFVPEFFEGFFVFYRARIAFIPAFEKMFSGF